MEILILITDLTYMRNGICIAGIDIETGRNYRPVLNYEHIQQEYAMDKRIMPCAIVKFDVFQRPNIKKPHQEDVIFIPEKTEFIRFTTQTEWEDYLDRYSSNSLSDAFDNCIIDNKGIRPLSDCPSLTILRVDNIRVNFFDSDAGAILPFKCRVTFYSDDEAYHLPVTDMQFIDYCIERFESGDSRQAVKADLERVINESEYIYLRIGLTRPFKKSHDSEELCYLQVNGIYAEILDGMIRRFEKEVVGSSPSYKTEKKDSLQFKIFNVSLQKSDDTLMEFNRFLEGVNVKRIFANVVNNSFWSVLVGYTESIEKQRESRGEKFLCKSFSDLTDFEKSVYEHLRRWRADKAKTLGLPEYMIFANKSLMSIAKFYPKTPDDLLKIYGIGEKKVVDFGQEIINLLQLFGVQNPEDGEGGSL